MEQTATIVEAALALGLMTDPHASAPASWTATVLQNMRCVWASCVGMRQGSSGQPAGWGAAVRCKPVTPAESHSG